MITDTELYRLEEIRDEINDLMDETSAIVAGCDDYIIDGRAKKWIDNVVENITSETNMITMSSTIDELWDDFHNDKVEG